MAALHDRCDNGGIGIQRAEQDIAKPVRFQFHLAYFVYYQYVIGSGLERRNGYPLEGIEIDAVSPDAIWRIETFASENSASAIEGNDIETDPAGFISNLDGQKARNLAFEKLGEPLEDSGFAHSGGTCEQEIHMINISY